MLSFIQKIKKLGAGILILFFVFGVFAPLMPTTVHAADTAGEFENAFKIKAGLMTCAGEAIKDGAIAGSICLMTLQLATIVNVILTLVGILLRICSLLFDVVLSQAILNFANWGHNEALIEGWRIFRDTGNIFFIFILLYAAIGTILGLHSVDAKKMVVRILIIALLVNFSGVFTRVMIDASNSLAVHFYQEATNSNCDPGDAAADCTIGTSVMNTLHTVTLAGLGNKSDYGDGLTESIKGIGDNILSLLISGLAGIIFILLISFLLLASCLFFAVRAVKLLFLIMTSPVAYVTSIIPSYGAKISGMWWDTLAKELVFAPAFFLLFSITLKIGAASGAVLNIEDGNPLFMRTVVFFIFLIGLMFGCLMIASSLGAAGAEGAKKFGNKIATGLAIGAGAYVARNSVGRYAEKLRTNESFKAFTRKVPLGRFMDKGLSGVAGASFGGAKGGFVEARKERREAIKEFAEHQGKVDEYTEDNIRSTGAKQAETAARRDISGTATRLNITRTATETDAEFNRRVVEEAKKDGGGNAVEAAKARAHAGQLSLVERLKTSPFGSTVRAGMDVEKEHEKADKQKIALAGLVTRISESEEALRKAEVPNPRPEDVMSAAERVKLRNDIASLRVQQQQMLATNELLKNTARQAHGGGGAGHGGGGHGPAPAAAHPPAAAGGSGHAHGTP